ncbi:helix-turn-helix domain-containing protein [Hominenteromicrobium sp.]|uniref:helix-turn-helix domain-containing protein n=1 Tax=Hominenteromicrobium sp. TaxID=3073581 RepID=UPI003A92BEFF
MSGDQRAEEAIEIGKRIREFRVKKNMSQAALAEKANVSLSQISDIERGKTSMRLTTFIGIVEALQVSADVLLRTDIPEVNTLYKSEFAEVLADCTPSEIDSILKIVKEVKRSMHNPKQESYY